MSPGDFGEEIAPAHGQKEGRMEQKVVHSRTKLNTSSVCI